VTVRKPLVVGIFTVAQNGGFVNAGEKRGRETEKTLVQATMSLDLVGKIPGFVKSGSP